MGPLLGSAAGIGALLFVIAVIAMRKRAFPRATNWLMLAAGLGLAGLVGGVIGWIVTAVGALVGSVAGVAFGVSASALIAAVVALILYLDMHPKKHNQPTRATPWLALSFFPLLGATLGGVWATLPARATQAVTAFGSQLSTAISELLGGL